MGKRVRYTQDGPLLQLSQPLPAGKGSGRGGGGPSEIPVSQGPHQPGPTRPGPGHSVPSGPLSAHWGPHLGRALAVPDDAVQALGDVGVQAAGQVPGLADPVVVLAPGSREGRLGCALDAPAPGSVSPGPWQQRRGRREPRSQWNGHLSSRLEGVDGARLGARTQPVPGHGAAGALTASPAAGSS